MAKKSGHWYCPVCGEKHGHFFFERFFSDYRYWLTINPKRDKADQKRAEEPLYCHSCGAKLRRSKRSNKAGWIPLILLYVYLIVLSILSFIDGSLLESAASIVFVSGDSSTVGVVLLLVLVADIGLHIQQIRELIPYNAKESIDQKAANKSFLIGAFAIVFWCIWIYILGASYGAFGEPSEFIKAFFK